MEITAELPLQIIMSTAAAEDNQTPPFTYPYICNSYSDSCGSGGRPTSRQGASRWDRMPPEGPSSAMPPPPPRLPRDVRPRHRRQGANPTSARYSTVRVRTHMPTSITQTASFITVLRSASCIRSIGHYSQHAAVQQWLDDLQVQQQLFAF